jgi:hypothetical protein
VQLGIKKYVHTLFPAVAPTRQGRFPLNLPTETVREIILLLNCNEKTGTNI